VTFNHLNYSYLENGALILTQYFKNLLLLQLSQRWSQVRIHLLPSHVDSHRPAFAFFPFIFFPFLSFTSELPFLFLTLHFPFLYFPFLLIYCPSLPSFIEHISIHTLSHAHIYTYNHTTFADMHTRIIQLMHTTHTHICIYVTVCVCVS
jgi:hypothetical protein